MKGDFSRLTFHPSKNYAAVLHQQGRVWLDSDWNEDSLIRLSLFEQEAADMIGPLRSPATGESGPCCVPAPGTGFEISPNTDPKAAPDDFLIAGGHCYVNGIRSHLAANTSYLQQPDLPSAPRIPLPPDGSDLFAFIYLDVWHRLITSLEDDSIREVALGGPDTAARIKTVAQVRVALVPPSTPTAELVAGNLEKFAPLAGGGTLTILQPQASSQENPCQLPDPANFSGRENRFYRVEIHDGGDAGGGSPLTVNAKLAQDAKAGATSLVLAQALSADQALAIARWSSLALSDDDGAAWVLVAGVSTDGLTISLAIPLRAGFSVSKNATVNSRARFKWSRDNASTGIRAKVSSTDRETLTLATTGPDQAQALKQGDLVELTNDSSDLGPTKGHLTFLTADPDPDALTVTIADPLPSEFGPADAAMVLRRWDGLGVPQTVFSDAATPDMNLGDGVRIQFGGANLMPGDYWQFAARAADGTIEALTNAPPAGIRRFRSPLAIVKWTRSPLIPSAVPGPLPYSMVVLQDCRRVFPALIDFPKPEKGMRVVQVQAVDAAGSQLTPLPNDSSVVVTKFGGINVQCDRDVDPISISQATCTLRLDLPVTSPISGYQPLNLPGTIGASGPMITWRPDPAAQAKMPSLLSLKPSADRGILARLRLAGNFVWSLSTPRLFLDGDASGFPQSGVATQTLPTAGNRRTGDFEAWFWLIAPTPSVAGFQVDKSQVVSAGKATGTVTLDAAATTERTTVALGASNPALIAVPPTVDVLFGQSSAIFPVTALKGSGAVSLTATTSGGVATANLVVCPPIRTITLDPAQVPAGGTSRATITLDDTAAGGGQIALSSDNPSTATVPAGIAVPVGSRTATFDIKAVAGGAPTITASLDTSSATSSLSVLALDRIQFGKPQAAAGEVVAAQVLLDRTNQAAVIVALASDKPLVAPVPQNVTVPQGAGVGDFNITAGSVGGVAAITATFGSSVKTATLPVVAVTALNLPQQAVPGQSVTGTVTLSAASLVDVTVSLALSSGTPPPVALPQPAVVVRAGSSSTDFTVTVFKQTGPATLTAKLGTSSASATITVPALVDSLTVPSSPVLGGTTGKGTVTLSAKAPAGGTIVSLNSDNSPPVAVPATVTVAAGETTVSFDITFGSVVSGQPKTANITATTAAVSKTAALKVVGPAAVSEIRLASTSGQAVLNGQLNVKSGDPVFLSVTLVEPAPQPNGVEIPVANSSPGVTNPAFPGKITIGPGQNSFSASSAAAGTNSRVTTTLAINFGNVASKLTLVVDP